MLSWLPRVVGVWRAAKRLEASVTPEKLKGATTSRTTKAQWKGGGVLVLVLAGVVAGVGQVWPDSPLGGAGAQEAVLGLLLWALSPLASRLAGKLDGGAAGVELAIPPDPPEEVVVVRPVAAKVARMDELRAEIRKVKGGGGTDGGVG